MSDSTAAPPRTFAARPFFNFSAESPVRSAALPRVLRQGFCTSCMMP
jgi:hypothetical protein